MLNSIGCKRLPKWEDFKMRAMKWTKWKEPKEKRKFFQPSKKSWVDSMKKLKRSSSNQFRILILSSSPWNCSINWPVLSSAQTRKSNTWRIKCWKKKGKLRILLNCWKIWRNLHHRCSLTYKNLRKKNNNFRDSLTKSKDKSKLLKGMISSIFSWQIEYKCKDSNIKNKPPEWNSTLKEYWE